MAPKLAVLFDSWAEAGRQAHCERVAALSSELSSILGLPESERKLLEQAALSHHYPQVLLDNSARHRLLTEMGVKEDDGEPPIPENVREILRSFGGRRQVSSAAIARLAALLQISDDFDQFFEAEPLSQPDAADLCALSPVSTMMSYMQVISRADVSRVIDRLPVFPRTAKDIVKHASNADVNLRDLEQIASKDPVLAGLLVQTANSAYYSPVRRIGTIEHAISYIGIETTCRLFLAATFRPRFSSVRHHQLWNHCLDVAKSAERLARDSKLELDSAEAFLGGLVHDIGRLVFSIMPASFLERFYRLTLRGCPPVQVETCLSGLCHGEVGAQALLQCNFPDALIEAVRWHHRPERSANPLSSILYLAEFWSDSGEDLPSCVRFRTACEQAGVGPENIADAGRRSNGWMDSLRFAA